MNLGQHISIAAMVILIVSWTIWECGGPAKILAFIHDRFERKNTWIVNDAMKVFVVILFSALGACFGHTVIQTGLGIAGGAILGLVLGIFIIRTCNFYQKKAG